MKLIIRSETVTAGFEGLRLSMPILQGISIFALILGYLFGVGDRGQIFLILILILTRAPGTRSRPEIENEKATDISSDLSRQSAQLKKGGSEIWDGRNIQT